MDHSLPKGLSSPARRALAAAGIETLEDLTKISEDELLILHGMGPKAFEVLSASMKTNGFFFARDADSERISVDANEKIPRRIIEKEKSA